MSFFQDDYFISTIELSEVQPDTRNIGIGGFLLENALVYLHNTGIKGVELFYTSEGARRHAQKYGFEKQIKENDSLPWMFRALISTRSQKQVSGRMFVIWKNDCGDSSKSPDMFWPIVEDTNFPILTYCFKDWMVGLMENGKVISTNKAKRFFGNNPVEFNGEYLFINHSFEKWFQQPIS